MTPSNYVYSGLDRECRTETVSEREREREEDDHTLNGVVN